MSDTLKLTGVILKSFTRKPADGGTASFRSNYPTEATCKAMGWGGMAMGESKGTLTVSYVQQTAMDLSEEKEARLIDEAQAKDTARDD